MDSSGPKTYLQTYYTTKTHQNDDKYRKKKITNFENPDLAPRCVSAATAARSKFLTLCLDFKTYATNSASQNIKAASAAESHLGAKAGFSLGEYKILKGRTFQKPRYGFNNSPVSLLQTNTMDETFGKVVQFFMTFVVDNCKKSTVRELPNIMAVYNLFGFKSQTQQSLVSKISDQQMAQCLRRGLEYVKGHIGQLQAMEDGIPVTGGSIESWRFENISLDIISQDTRLHNTADFQVESINVNMAENKFHIVARWPIAHLTETYILRGSVDNKRVYGAGRFRISVLNFVMTAFIHFQEEESTINIKNVVMTGDFEDARINISGLEVEGNENAEQLMNNAIQRDKQKFREILHRNMDLLSKELVTVLNSKLSTTHKNAVFNLIASWCNL